MTTCPSCSADNPDQSKHCSECGAALSPEYEPTEVPPPTDSSHSFSSDSSSHHGRFLPGAKVADRYRIVSLLGKGGMGEVYRADDLKLGHTVALKFLPKNLANDPQRLEYFLNEVRLTRQISHPNVCRVYDIGEVEGQHFLSMEYIDGEDLRALLRRIGKLPNDKGIQIAQQLCAGLTAAHEKGVLHRDLKPANIMLDGRGQVRITDFGLAKLSDEDADGLIVGTPAYMAPEQLSQGETAIQSDLYSLGLILYELFTGEPVHKTNSLQQRLKEHDESSLSNQFEHFREIDPLVHRVLLRCLEREPGDRPESAKAVAAALPGGDPLAAAVAAGETPSPELVAASGKTGTLSPRVGTVCLIYILVGWLLMPFFSQFSASGSVSIEGDQPAKLAGDLQEDILGPLGLFDPEHPPKDAVYGLRFDHPPGEPTVLNFWYRQFQDGDIIPVPSHPILGIPSYSISPFNPSPFEPR